MNIKIIGLLGSNFASANGDIPTFKIDIFTPQVSTHARVNFYPEIKSFTKMEINLVG